MMVPLEACIVMEATGGILICIYFVVKSNSKTMPPSWNHIYIMNCVTSCILRSLRYHKLLLRMQRYAAAARKGRVKADPQLLVLWGSEQGRIMAAFFLCS